MISNSLEYFSLEGSKLVEIDHDLSSKRTRKLKKEEFVDLKTVEKQSLKQKIKQKLIKIHQSD